MASLHAALRGQVLSGAHDLAQVMSNVNRLLYEATAANRYATLFVAQLDIPTRTLVYVNGGHNAPMLLRHDGTLLRFNEGGSVVGLFPDIPFVSGAAKLAPGDELIAFTDGITEAMNGADEEYGEERLLECTRTTDRASPKSLVAAIFASVDAFAHGTAQYDDMTVIVLRVNE
jgi:serine phosphatase RsbU (regulator of sigma subunit)